MTPPTILIVDDLPANISVVYNHLQQRGYKVLVAQNGKSALQKAQIGHPDLILLDVMMPDMDGYETCKHLKADVRTKEIPIIFMTALDALENKVEAFSSGAVDYVTKPIQYEELIARVETHLNLRYLTLRLEEQVAKRTVELETAYAHLAKLDTAKSDFIQVMSHELRTPLAITKMSMQMLEMLPIIQDNTQAMHLITRSLYGIDSLHQLVNRLLLMTKLETETIEAYWEPLDLTSLFYAVQLQYETALDQRQINLCVTLDGLPAVYGDSQLLQTLFSELLSNAIKYTPDGGQIKIQGEVESEEKVLLSICDSGIGIDPAYHELIFEKFYQTGDIRMHSTGHTKFKGGGAGLGLAMARAIVTLHQGDVWVESSGCDEEIYPGSCFYIYLHTIYSQQTDRKKRHAPAFFGQFSSALG